MIMISTLTTLTGVAHAHYGSGSAQSTQIASNNKLSVSVSPSMVGYTQFEHVRGVASDNSGSGVSVHKINILNSLINRLVDMNKIQKPDTIENESTQLDSLIKEYQKKIQETEQVAQSNPYALSGAPSNATGVLFSIAA